MPGDRSRAASPAGSPRTASSAQRLGQATADQDAWLLLDQDTPVFVISVAAQLAGMHPQTLRQYDRLGLVRPGRAAGRGRRYSPRDVAMLREVQRLSQEDGVNLAGIKRILELEVENARLRERAAMLAAELDEAQARLAAGRRIFAAGPAGEIVAYPPGRRPHRGGGSPSTALVVWRPPARRA